MREAVQWFPATPQRSAARVWDLLWQLHGGNAALDMGRLARLPCPAAVTQFVEQVELQLHQRTTVESLADAADVSQGHLIRLCHQHLNRTPVAYLRYRRIQRAADLLRHSTLPIKTIAVEVGIPDLHLFNKTVRRELGVSPSAYRANVSVPPKRVRRTGWSARPA